MSDFSKVIKIFPILAQNFLKILLVSPYNFSAKYENLQLAATPVFNQRCYQYTQSTCIYSKLHPAKITDYIKKCFK